MIFISDVQNYVQIKLCKTAGSIHLFKIIGMLKAKSITLNKNFLWDTLEIDWKKVTVTFNNNKIDLPKVVIIKLQDKIKVRRLMKRKPLLFHLILKQGITWFTLATETPETIQILNKYRFTLSILFSDGLYPAAQMQFLAWLFRCHLLVETIDVKVRITTMQGTHMFRRDKMSGN